MINGSSKNSAIINKLRLRFVSERCKKLATVCLSISIINYLDGLNSYVFEIDPQFSTYYDYKVARIIANDLLYNYLLTKISPEENAEVYLQNVDDIKELSWTDSKNALIELMYALYASGAISGGKLGIRKLTAISQVLFRISLTDVHHAFHRMKTRAGSRTLFLDQLKQALEEYMDKDL